MLGLQDFLDISREVARSWLVHIEASKRWPTALLLLNLAALATACASRPGPAPVGPTVNMANAPAGRPPVDCGPEISGIDGLSETPLVILGEVHGQAGPPAFAIDFACRRAVRTGAATLALEIPRQEQARIDTYLRGNGSEGPRKALLGGSFWTREFQDGRSSRAMFEVLEKARRLVRAGLAIHVAAIDDEKVTNQAPREVAMASALGGLVESHRGPVIVLVGNLHARTTPGAPWDPSLRLMGVHVKEKVPRVVSLDVRYGQGDSWLCLSNKASECGPKSMKGDAVGPRWAIDLSPTLDEEGFSGTFSVGPAVASVPARRSH